MNNIKEFYYKFTEALKNKLISENDESLFIIDGIYECHAWVSLIKNSPNVEIFLFNEDMIDEYLEISELKNIKNHYFEYVYGHSFIKVNNIFIDLTLDSEGFTFEEIQKFDLILSKNKSLFN